MITSVSFESAARGFGNTQFRSRAPPFRLPSTRSNEASPGVEPRGPDPPPGRGRRGRLRALWRRESLARGRVRAPGPWAAPPKVRRARGSLPPFCAPTVPLADRSRLPVWPVQVRPRRGRRGGSSRDRRHRPSGVTAGARTSRCASRPAKRPCARRRRWDSTPPRRRGAAAGDTRARAVARARRFPRLPVLRPPHRRHVCAAAERAHVRRPSPLPDVPPADCLWSREREP